MSFSEDIKTSIAIGSGDYDTAIEIYTSRLKKDKADLTSLYGLASCYEGKGDKDRTIEYANKALAINPNCYYTLMIVARYWRSLNDADRTYLYVCRIVDNPPIQVPETPEWVFWLLKPLSVFRSFRHLEKNTKINSLKSAKRGEANLKWAKEYKAWYEISYGNKQKKTIH